MKKIIVADTSTGCLDYYNHDYDIRTIRLDIYFENEKFIDGLNLSAQEFVDKVNQNPEILPHTSQPTLGELSEFFEGLIKEGYEEVFVTTISSKLSGVYNGILAISNMLDNIKIHIFDTRTVCFNEGLFALEAARLFSEGKSVEEVVEFLDNLRKNNSIFFVVDNLKYLVKNGRLSGASGFVGNVLKLKPLLQVVDDGSIVAVEKIRTTRRALERACDLFIEYVKNYKEYTCYILYMGNPSLLSDLKLMIKEKTNLDVLAIPSSPVVGIHVGPDAIGIGVFLNKKNTLLLD